MKKCTVSTLFLFGTFFGMYLYTGKIPYDLIDETIPQDSKNTSEKNISAKERYEVIRIVDGDTIVLRINGNEEKVRLIGLNTPETVDPRKTVECFGKEASDEAKKILSGKTVSVETDPSQGFSDKYGRLLAYLFLSDGTNFNKLMIENGYGYEYTYNAPYKYQKEFKTAEKDARVNKHGLWADGICKQ